MLQMLIWEKIVQVPLYHDIYTRSNSVYPYYFIVYFDEFMYLISFLSENKFHLSNWTQYK